MAAKVGLYSVVLAVLFVPFAEAHKSDNVAPSACYCTPTISVAMEGNKCDLCKGNQKLEQDIADLRRELYTIQNGSSPIQPGNYPATALN